MITLCSSLPYFQGQNFLFKGLFSPLINLLIPQTGKTKSYFVFSKSYSVNWVFWCISKQIFLPPRSFFSFPFFFFGKMFWMITKNFSQKSNIIFDWAFKLQFCSRNILKVMYFAKQFSTSRYFYWNIFIFDFPCATINFSFFAVLQLFSFCLQISYFPIFVRNFDNFLKTDYETGCYIFQ